MARLVTSGNEFRVAGILAANSSEGENYVATGPPTVETTVVRSGAAAWKATANGQYARWNLTTADANTYYVRAYLRFPDITPGADVTLISATPSAQAQVVLQQDGTGLALRDDANAQVGADVGVLADTWYRVELEVKIGTSPPTSSVLRMHVTEDVPGAATTTVGVTSNADLNTTITDFRIGHTSATASTDVVYWDDVAINDSTGGVDDGLPGPGKVILKLAASDQARGADWDTAAGSTSNLFAEVDNTPPAAVPATPVDFIKSLASNTAAPDAAYATETASYGLAATDTVKIVQAVAVIGDNIGGSTLSAGLQLTDNPTDGAEVTGSTLSAAVTAYPAGWVTIRGNVNSSPSVTLGNPIRVRVRKNTATTNALYVALLGAYVEYRSAQQVTLTPATETDAAQALDVDKRPTAAAATEADSAQALDADKHVALAPATETDTAQALTFRNAIDVSITAADESDAAQAFDADKQVTLSPASEADQAQALVVTHVRYRDIAPGAEGDQAQALDADKRTTVTPAGETDAAQALSVTKTIYVTLTPATEADEAQTLGITRNIYRTLTPALETDEAQALSIQAGTPLEPGGGVWVPPTRRRLRAGPPHIIFLMPAGERDAAVPLTFRKVPNQINVEDDELLLLS